MNVNIKGAASNCYAGISELLEVIDDFENYSDMGDFHDALSNLIVKYQPKLAAYCLKEYFDNE